MVEIEIDGKFNEALFFRPLQRRVRGMFDYNKIGEPMARVMTQKFPMPIPSQRLGIDPDGNGYLLEPLHAPEFAPIKEKIELHGERLEPATQAYENIDVPTWMYWMKRAVDCGLARVTKGQLPDVVEGPVRKNFILADPEPSPTDRLTSVLELQVLAFNRLADAIEKMVQK